MNPSTTFSLRVALLCLSWGVAACTSPMPGEDDAKTPPPPVDAGALVRDAGADDAGVGMNPDAGSSDAGAVDAGEADAGPDDAGLADAGPGDAGAPDAGSPDAGPPDAGCSCGLPSYCTLQNVCAVDTAAPRLTVTASPGSAPGKVRVRGSAADPETGIPSVEVRINQGVSVAVPVVMGMFDGDLDAAGGESTITVSGSDRAGNSASVQTTYDPSPPVITLQPGHAQCGASGCTGAVISSATTSFTVTATVTDLALAAANPVRIRVATLGGAELVPPSNMSLQGGSVWTWTWSSLPALDDTAIHFEVTATDAAGNVGSASVNGRIDRVAPTLTATPSMDATCDASGCTGAVISLSPTGATMTGTTSASTVSLRVRDGAAVVVPMTALSVDSTGAWTWTWTSPPTVDGRFYGVELAAADAVGNTTTLTRAVLVDRVLPSLVVTAPAPGTLTGSPTIAVVSSAADSLGVRAVQVATQPAGPFTTASLDANGDYVATMPVPVVNAVSQGLTIRATDLAGNTRTATRSYVADRVAPVVTVNGADFDCSGSQCTGVVANRSTTSLTFTGTATDGSAISLTKTIVGTAPVTTATDAVTGGAWSWSWSSFPSNVDGAAFELRLVATDAAGNASAPVVRRVWLDNVAPRVTAPVGGQRNVSRTSTLLSFSEPMVVSSVVSGTSLTPAVPLTNFRSTDGRSFAFTALDLAHYQTYRLTHSSGVDLAGNPVSGQTDVTFLSEPVMRGAQTVVSNNSGSRASYPVLAVDSDQQIYLYARVTSFLGISGEARILQGDGSNVAVINPWPQANFVRAGEMRIVAESRGADQRLTPTIEHTLVLTTGAGTYVGLGTQTHSAGASGLIPNFLTATWGPVIPTTAADVERVRPTVELRTYASGMRRNFVVPNAGLNAMLSVESSGSQWTSMTPATLSGLQRMDARASLEATGTPGQSRIRYYDGDAMSEVGTAGFVRAATGQPTLKRLDAFFGVPVARSGAYVAWANDTQLTIACSPAPFAAVPVWRPTALALPATTTTTGLTSTMDASRVIFAAEFGGSVYVYATPITDCAASPAATRLALLPGMKQPNVFIDGSGRVWVAAINGNDEVVVHKL